MLLLLSIGGVRAGHDSGIASLTAVRSLLFDTTYLPHSQSEGLTFTWTPESDRGSATLVIYSYSDLLFNGT